MKKFLTLAIIVLSSLFIIKVNAAEYSDPNTDSKVEVNYSYLNNKLDSIWWRNLKEDWFKENESPAEYIVLDYMVYEMEEHFSEYVEYEIVTDPETGEQIVISGKYFVPANVFEDVIKKSFNVNEDYIINLRDNTLRWGEFAYVENNGEYYYQFEPFYGGGGEEVTEEISFLGYKALGNDYYELYSNFVKYSESGEIYVPKTNEVYGKDYIVFHYSYEDENDKVVHEYEAVKNIGYTKTRIYYDGKYIKFLSHESIEKEDMIDITTLVTEITPKISTKTDDASISAPEGAFIDGTKITLEKQEKGTIYDAASKALKEKYTNFVIFEINAKAGDYDVEPSKKVTITINVPEGYKNPVIYYVTEDGKIEKIDTKVKDGKATAELSHFSTYALVDETVTVVEKVEQTVDKVVESVVENPKLGAASALGAIALALGGTLIYLNIKKKNKFPQA